LQTLTTAEYNADNPFAVAVGNARGHKAEKTSYVLCHQPKSFDWRSRKAAPHPLQRLSDHPFAEVCARLNQIVNLA
jgi:mRNA interferase MazF